MEHEIETGHSEPHPTLLDNTTRYHALRRGVWLHEASSPSLFNAHHPLLPPHSPGTVTDPVGVVCDVIYYAVPGDNTKQK